MSKKEEKKTTISIDGVEYIYEDMPQEQQLLVNHIEDLNRKIASSEFNLDQLKIGRGAFFDRLKAALDEPQVEEIQQED